MQSVYSPVKTILFAGILFASHSACAAQKIVSAMLLAGDQAQMQIMLGGLANNAGNGPAVDDAMKKLSSYKTAFDESVRPALKSAKNHPDLAKAIREYHQAATEFFAAGIPLSRIDEIRSSALEQAFEAKQKAVQLEVSMLEP